MLIMRHHSRRALSDKQNALNTQNSNRRAMIKPCNKGISVPYHSSVCSNNKTTKHYNMPHKMKRLKTIKQRNHIRMQSSNGFNNHQHCEGESKAKRRCSDYQDCQCSCSLHFSRKEKPVAKPFPSQKPSIITEGRVTSIRGLFSHEVRSVDIERLVKEKKQTHVEKGKDRQATASNSPSSSCVIPHSTPPVVVSETSEEGISACANKDQKSKTLITDHLQTNLKDTVPVTLHSTDGNHSSTQTPKATDNTAKFASPPDQKVRQEAVIMSSSENHPVHESFSTSFKISQSVHKVISKKKNTQKQTNKITAAVSVQEDFVNSERLATPAGLEALNLDVPQFDPSPTVFLFSSPTLDNEKSKSGKDHPHRKPVFSSKEETVSRLAARLCDNLGPFPLQRQGSGPLLTDCRKVLLDHLQERHDSKLQHSLRKIHSQLCAEGPYFPDTAAQDWPRAVQRCLHNPQMSFSYARKHEEDKQNKTMEFQTDNSPPKHCLCEGFCEKVDSEGASKRQRKQTWGIYSSQDFVKKLQRPCQDTLSQWSITAQSPESFRIKQHSKSQTFSLHQAFTESQTPPWSYCCTDQILDTFFPDPQKLKSKVKSASGESRRRNSTALPLLEQWRNDPDLNFLFQEETSRKTCTSFGPVAELRDRSPDHDIKRVTERQLFGTSSSVSAFFPPKGFCYEPYYRFPHPSNSFNRSEKSRTSLYTQPDVEKRDYGPSLHLSSPYF